MKKLILGLIFLLVTFTANAGDYGGTWMGMDPDWFTGDISVSVDGVVSVTGVSDVDGLQVVTANSVNYVIISSTQQDSVTNATTNGTTTITKAGDNFTTTCSAGDMILIWGGTTTNDYGVYHIVTVTDNDNLVLNRAVSGSNADVDFYVFRSGRIVTNVGFMYSANSTLHVAPSGSATSTWSWEPNTLAPYYAGGALKNTNTTATAPGVLPNKNDSDTGIGSNGSDQLSLIAGAWEGVRVVETTPESYVTINGDLRVTRDFFYDAMWNSIAPEWAARVSTGSQAPYSDAIGGVWRLTSGATDTNEESIDWNDIFVFRNDFRPSFEIRANIQTTTNNKVEFGLFGSNAADYIKIVYDASADANWHLITSKNGASTNDDAGSAAATGRNDFRFVWSSDTALEWFINGVSQGTISTAANIPTDWLQPAVIITTQENVAHWVQIFYVKIWQDTE